MLSNELLLDIFQYLPKPALKACLFVCKNWYLLLAPIYYKEAFVVENEMNDFLLFIQDSDHVKWIKKIIICKSYQEPKYLSTKDYCRLFSRLFNLEKIYVHQTVNTIWYLEHLLTIDTSMLKSIKEIKLLNDTRLHYNDNNRYLDERMAYWYSLNTVRLCSTITHLEMNNFSVGYFTYQNREQRFTAYLNCFHHLTHLKIENLLTSGIPSLSFVAVLEQCQELKAFDFLSEYPQKNNAFSHDEVNTNDKLQQFKLQIPSLSTFCISYIVRYIPPHIRNFSIITTNSFLPDTNMMDSLLSNIKTIRLEMKGEEPWHEGSDNYYLTTPSCIRRFWRTMNIIKGLRRPKIDMDITLDHFTPFPETKVYLDNANRLKFSISHTDPHTYSDSNYFPSSELVHFLGLQHSTSTQLNSFVLKERGMACISTHQLALLIKHLMHLKYINITSEPFFLSESSIFNYDSFLPNQTTSLLLSPVAWNKTTNGFILQTKKDDRMDWLDGYDCMKYGTLDNVYITQELLDALNQLEYFQLRKCRYEKDEQNNIYLKLNKVEELVMLMDRSDTEYINEFIIRIMCQEGAKHYWYSCTEHNDKHLRVGAINVRKATTMVITIECAYLNCFQFEVRGRYSEKLISCTIYPE